MKALLICPAERSAVTALAQRRPLATLPFLGQSLLEYWLQHLATLGAKRVLVLAADRPGDIAALTGDGARWGLQVDVVAAASEPTVAEARARHQADDDDAWLAAPNDIVVVDHPPLAPTLRPLESYADWFAAARDWIPHALTPDRVGLREVRPGVWLGFHAHIAPTAQLIGPCWIGDDAYVGPGAIIGPNAVLENRVLVEGGAHIFDSVIGPDTFVGGVTEVGHSLAWGSQLINWLSGSTLRVTEEYLLCSLEPLRTPLSPTNWIRRKAGVLTRTFAAPVHGVLRRARTLHAPTPSPRPLGSRVP